MYKRQVNDNLKVGSKITTFSGIIGEVTNIQGEVVTILSGEYDSATKLKIKKSEIENILS